MRYKQFGKTDMNVSVLTVGTWAIGGARWGKVEDKLSIEAIQAMLKNGVNFIDTAPVYGAGHAEEVVGQAIKGLDRSKLYIATKFGLPIGDGHGGYKRDNVMWENEDSLRRMGIDYIDLYIVHWPDRTGETPISVTMAALNELKEAGKIRYIGVSNFSKEQIIEAQQYADIVALQPPYSMVSRQQQPLMEWCRDQGIGTMTYGSLGGGILTGTIRTLPDWPEDDTRLRFYDSYREPKFSKVMELLKTLDDIVYDHMEEGATVAQVAVNWQTQKDFVSTALTGVRNKEEANENCAGTAWSLSASEMQRIDDAIMNTIGIEAPIQRPGRPAPKKD